MLRIICNTLLALTLTTASLAIRADHHEQPEESAKGGARAMAMTVEAEVVAIDLDTRQVTLKGPMGETFSIAAREQYVSLDDVSVGDKVEATYLAAIEGELREPTESEKAQPWVVLEDEGAIEAGADPTVGAARMIRAVCTIEGMNRLLGTVTVLDSRGVPHIIDQVEPEKMSGVTLGQTIVLVYTEAVALSLRKTSE